MGVGRLKKPVPPAGLIVSFTRKCHMSTSSTSFVCAVCGQSLPAARQGCSSCHTSAAWQDLFEAGRFVSDRFLDWAQAGLIGPPQSATIVLAEARRRGHRTVNGLGMLINQARPAFQAWFGVLPEITPELRAAVQATFTT